MDYAKQIGFQLKIVFQQHIFVKTVSLGPNVSNIRQDLKLLINRAHRNTQCLLDIHARTSLESTIKLSEVDRKCIYRSNPVD